MWYRELLASVMCLVLVGACSKKSGENPGTSSWPEFLTGAIEGTALDCWSEPSPLAVVQLNRMPADIDRECNTVRRMEIFGEEFITSVQADSGGSYYFSNVKPGLYQVVVRHFGSAFLDFSSPCDAGAIDFVRVACDSASIANPAQINGVVEMVHMARIWIPRFRSLDGGSYDESP